MDRNNNNHQVPLANPHGSSSNHATSSFLVAAIADQRQPSEVVDDQQQQETSVKQYGNAVLGIVVPLSCTNNHKSPLIRRQQVDPYYQDQKLPPCQLSSSIYYGGQDIIPRPMNMKKSYTPNYSYSAVNQGVSGASKNDVDSEEFANIGDWWKGSFYY